PRKCPIEQPNQAYCEADGAEPQGPIPAPPCRPGRGADRKKSKRESGGPSPHSEATTAPLNRNPRSSIQVFCPDNDVKGRRGFLLPVAWARSARTVDVPRNVPSPLASPARLVQPSPPGSATSRGA